MIVLQVGSAHRGYWYRCRRHVFQWHLVRAFVAGAEAGCSLCLLFAILGSRVRRS